MRCQGEHSYGGAGGERVADAIVSSGRGGMAAWRRRRAASCARVITGVDGVEFEFVVKSKASSIFAIICLESRMVQPVYWYISKTKVDSLKDAPLSLFEGITAKFNFALRPFLSGSISKKSIPDLKRDLAHVDSALRSAYSIKQYYELSESDAPVWFAFRGPAARYLTGESFWIGMHHSDIGLAMGGSAQFVMGASARMNKGHFMTSIDPVTALSDTLQQRSSRPAKQCAVGADRLAFAWGSIMSGTCYGGTLPQVEGLAIFARTFLIEDDNSARIKRAAHAEIVRKQPSITKLKFEPPKIRRLIVGTPLYVRQV
jgi:hypothetical protein